MQIFASHNGGIVGADWHPDGIHVVTGDFNGVAKVWNSITGEEVASYSTPGDVVTVNWSPDGTQIVVAGAAKTEPVIRRVWLSTHELIAHAYDCCVTRDLTPEERIQFGLPERS